jgi:FixJ family two-component response regulator
MCNKDTNIYIIDDDLVILNLYSMMLKGSFGKIITYKDGYKFLTDYDESKPACAIIDLNMQTINGLELFKKMKELNIMIPVIFISGSKNSDTIAELFREGAFDFIEKPYMNCELMVDRIQKALLNDETEIIVRKKLSRCKDYLSKLSDREKSILNQLCIGNSAKVIAKELNISYRTVETHIANIKSKTQLDTHKLIGKNLYLQAHQ